MTIQVVAAPPELISTRLPGAGLPAGGNSDSVSPILSPDGRFVLFASSASDLVTGDNNQWAVDVFLRDRASNTTTLVSASFAGMGGGNGHSRPLAVSTNGRYAAFESDATDLLPGDTNALTDLFVRDLWTGTNLLVNVSTNGGRADGESADAVMTPDGRYVAFGSAATNLVIGDTNGMKDVFVRDLALGTTVRASAGAVNGARTGGDTPVITPDGRYAAFYSTATGLVAGVSSTRGEIYVRDLVVGQTTWASTNAATIALAAFSSNNIPSYHPSISDDGRYVVFKTGSSTGVGGTLVLRHDLTTGLTTTVSSNGFPGSALSDDIYGPEISGDGQSLVFAARQINSQLYATVQLWNATWGTNVLMSVTTNGAFPTNTISHTPAITPDGRFVTFLSGAANLTTNTVSAGFHVYLRDILAGTTTLVDADAGGAGSTDVEGTVAKLSSDGRFVTFCGPDGALVGLDHNLANDVFVRDTVGNATELVSARDANLVPSTGNGVSALGPFSFSADGRWLAFTSLGDDLSLNDTNRAKDVFVRDLVAGTNLLVSIGTNGVAASGGASANPVISADGRFVTFVSAASNLVTFPSHTNLQLNQIYVHDLQARTNLLVSIATNGMSPGDGDSSVPVISQDGRVIAFLSSAANLAPGISGAGPHTFLRDLSTGMTMSPAATSTSLLPPSLSVNGRYLAYSAGSQLRVWDAQQSANIYTYSGSPSSFALSPTGAKLAYVSLATLYLADVVHQTNLFSYPNPSGFPLRNSGQWSADERFFAFVTTSSTLGFGDTNNATDVFLRDTTTNVLSLVSVRDDHMTSGNAASDSPAVSWDGRFVVFRSFATNIITGQTEAPPNLFVFDRFTGSNTVLFAPSPLSSNTTRWVAWPVVSADGQRVAFGSWGSLVTNDFNRAGDVFALTITSSDIDADGLDDAWEQFHFGSLARDGTLDFDSDGVTDLAEFLSGTNPADPASALRLQISAMVSSNSVVLVWSAVPGKTYRVQFKVEVVDPTWSDVADVLVTSLAGQFTVPADQSRRFYRLVALD